MKSNLLRLDLNVLDTVMHITGLLFWGRKGDSFYFKLERSPLVCRIHFLSEEYTGRYISIYAWRDIYTHMSVFLLILFSFFFFYICTIDHIQQEGVKEMHAQLLSAYNSTSP